MRKIWIWLMIALMAVGLWGCGNNSSADSEAVITRSTEAATEVTQPATEAAAALGAAEFAHFQVEGQALITGTQWDSSVLPEANSVYQVPSCAIEGTDNVYSYDNFEITAYDDGICELIYSVYFLTPDITTPEGLALGDSLEEVLALYGENCERVGTACNYYCGETMLSIIVQNDIVISIEYRMVIE